MHNDFVRPILPIALLILTLAPCTFAQIQPSPEHFSAQDKTVLNPATLPDSALQLLLRDETVRRATHKATHIPPKWLLVSQVQLGASDTSDYIVLGRGPLANAGTAPFWIFRQHGKSTDLVFTASAHDLILRTTETHGLRDLEIVNIHPNAITIADYGFNGSRYQLRRTRTEKIK